MSVGWITFLTACVFIVIVGQEKPIAKTEKKFLQKKYSDKIVVPSSEFRSN